jgi:hypothetical protein
MMDVLYAKIVVGLNAVNLKFKPILRRLALVNRLIFLIFLIFQNKLKISKYNIKEQL